MGGFGVSFIGGGFGLGCEGRLTRSLGVFGTPGEGEAEDEVGG